MNQPQLLNRDALRNRIKCLDSYCENIELIINHMKRIRDTKQITEDEYNHWKWWVHRTLEELV